MSVKEELRSLVDALPEDQAVRLLEDLRNEQALRAAIDHADEQLANGEFTEYDTIQDLTDAVESRGMARLAKEHQNADR